MSNGTTEPIRLLQRECDRLGAENLRLAAENAAHRETNLALVAEVSRLAGELTIISRVLGKRLLGPTTRGRLTFDLPESVYVAAGRRAAGLAAIEDDTTDHTGD